MNDNPSSPSPTPGSTPPATPIPPSAPSGGGTKWPKVIGIIALILGVIGLLSPLLQGMGYFGTRLQFQDIPGIETAQDQVDAYLADYLVFLLVTSAVGVVLSAILIVAAVQLLKRRKKAIPLLRGWAVVDILATIPIVVINYLFTKRQMELMFGAMTGDESSQADAQVASVITEVASGVGAFFGLLLSLAFPVFLLIWFARAKIRVETQEWS